MTQIQNKINFTPVVINSEDDLVQIITSYFASCDLNDGTPTYTELAMILGLTRHQLKDFPKDHKFFPIIQKAKQLVVIFAEKQLFLPKQSAGVQFWLKNNDDWVDKTDVTIHKAKSMMEIIEEIENENKKIVDGQIVFNQIQNVNPAEPLSPSTDATTTQG